MSWRFLFFMASLLVLSATSATSPSTPENSTTYIATTTGQQQTTLQNIVLPNGYDDYGILVNGGYTLQASNGQNTINIALQAINLADLCDSSKEISISFAP
jgi:ABC-type tungstate transport system permease subunit